MVLDSTNATAPLLPSVAMPAAVPATEIRARVLGAMATLTAEKGYAAVTIDDIARAARISKRTFYDHFDDKQRCLLAAYEDAAAHVFDVCERAAAPGPPWRERVDAVLGAYLKALAARPEMTRVFHVEIQAAGAEALELHLRVNLRYTALLRRIVREGGERTLDRTMAIALLGAVHELVLHAIAEDRTRRLPAVLKTVAPLIDAALGAPARSPARAART
jgi:AcrR family transcriptional regulator